MSIQTELEQMYSKRFERKELKRPPSGQTIYQHKNNLTKIHKTITGKMPGLIGEMSWLDDMTAEEILNVIKEIPGRKNAKIGTATQRSYLTSLLVACRCNDFYHGADCQLFKDTSDILSGMEKELVQYRADLKEENKEKIPQFSALMEETNNYLKEPLGDIDTKIILSIYTQMPVRLEIAELIYIKNKREYNKMKRSGGLTGNYLVMGAHPTNANPPILSLSKYKTAHTYGTQEIIIKDRYLMSLLKQKGQGLTEFQPLFTGLTRNALTKRITEFYKKRGYNGISPTLLAKMIDTRAYDNLPDELKTTMKTLAEFRRHSLDTQSKYYIHN